MIRGIFMYEEIVKFIRDKNRFSPTILYDILRSEYMIDYFALQKTEKVMQRQKVNSIYDINYSILNLSDTIAVLNAVYLQDNNLVCPSKMFNNGKLFLIANRLDQLDIPPINGAFDDRKYYKIRNLLLMAMRASAFTGHRLIVNFQNELLFFNDSKELNEVRINFQSENFGETLKYLHAIADRKWIKIFEPEFVEYYVIYPGERIQNMLNPN